MPSVEIKEIVPATAAAVFDLIHDYDRRLEWDTLLSEAYLELEFERAALGAISVCRGRKSLGAIAMRTIYVSFQPGKVAAVKLLNRPPFFKSFAASIRHRNLGDGRSELIYKLNFSARPQLIDWILHPLMRGVLIWETRRRLSALRDFFKNNDRRE